jgi:alpha-1,2-mannosyltransferase
LHPGADFGAAAWQDARALLAIAFAVHNISPESHPGFGHARNPHRKPCGKGLHRGSTNVPGISFLAHLAIVASGVFAAFWCYRRRASPPAALPAGIMLIALPLLYFSFRATFPREIFWDFIQCYLQAGRAVLHWDLATLTTLYERTAQGFVNMPIIAFLFSPFALLGDAAAGWLFAALGVVATVLAWRWLCTAAELPARGRMILGILFLANGPLISSLKFGNTSHFLLFGLVGAMLLLRAGRQLSAGMLLGFLAIMKPPMGLFAVYFLLRREWRGLAGVVASGALISLASLLVFGLDYNLFWFRTSILQFGHQWFSGFNVQSIPGFIARLRDDPGLLTNWQPVERSAGEHLAALLAIGGLYLAAAAACLYAVRHATPADDAASRDRRRDLQFMLVTSLTLVASPLSWSHYYCWLLIPIAFFLGATLREQQDRVVKAAGWLGILLVTPLVVMPGPPTASALWNFHRMFGVSHLLAGGLLWFGLLCWWLVTSSRRREPLPA